MANLFRNLFIFLHLILPRINVNNDISLRLHRRIEQTANLCKEGLLNKFSKYKYK